MKPSVVAAIGTFDGVHLGHQSILKKVVERARRLSLRSLVVTFDLHPRNVLGKGSDHIFITDVKEKRALIRSHGIDHVLVLKTDARLLSMSAYEFLRFIGRRFIIRELVSGSDFRFGKDAAHGAHTIDEIVRDFGLQFHILPKKKIDGMVAASSRVRTLIAQGKVDDVKKILGRFYALSGKVVSGKGIGRQLGFPTANVSCGKNIFLRSGVYAAYAQIGNKMFSAAVNIGNNPTIDPEGKLSVEAHLIDFHKNILGRNIKLHFLKYLRDEKKFSSRQELIKAITSDIAAAKKSFPEL